jgi:hypothetical protein
MHIDFRDTARVFDGTLPQTATLKHQVTTT